MVKPKILGLEMEVYDDSGLSQNSLAAIRDQI